MKHLGVVSAVMAVAMTMGVFLAACAPAAAPPKPAPAAPTEAALSPAAAPAANPVAFDEKAVADFYRGKTIRIVVGLAPGGTFDLYSRLLAKHMPQYLPGSPATIMENKPGAGSALAANAVYNTEPKDGTVIGSFAEYLALQQLLGAPGIQFDMGKFNWLGSSVNTAGACLARTGVGINSMQDLTDGKELVIGTTGPGVAVHDIPAILNAAIGTRFKLVSGYDGVAKAHMSFEAGEVDGYCGAFDGVLLVGRQMLEGENPMARLFVVTGSEPLDHPLTKGVPAAETLAKSEEARQLLRAVHVPLRISKPFAVAPEVPSDRVEALRRAMAAAFADPQFAEDAKKSQLELSPSTGDQVTSIVGS